LNVLLANGVNICHLRLYCRRTFLAYAVVKMMWCGTHDFLRDNNCQIGFVAIQLIISEPAHALLGRDSFLSMANVSRSYKKKKSGKFLWTAISRVILFLYSSIASGNNKEYLTAVFKYWLKSCKKNFPNILLKTAWLCDVRLHNYGVINFVPFLDHPVYTHCLFFCLWRYRKLSSL